MVFLLAAGVGILVLGTVRLQQSLFTIKGPLQEYIPSNALSSATDRNFDQCCGSGSHRSLINWRPVSRSGSLLFMYLVFNKITKFLNKFKYDMVGTIDMLPVPI
jgi:hypothetical protein